MLKKIITFIIQNICKEVYIISLILFCYIMSTLVGPESEYIFSINVVGALGILCYVFKMVYKKEYIKFIKRIIYIIIILIAANHLYLYENIIKLCPCLENVSKGLVLMIFMSLIVITFIIGILIRYIKNQKKINQINNDLQEVILPKKTLEFDKVETTQETNSNQIYEMQKNLKEENKSAIYIVIGILLMIILIVGSLLLYFKFDFLKIISKNPIQNLSSIVSSLIGYIASILFILFAIAIIMISFIELARLLVQRILLFNNERKNGISDNNSTLAFAFSIMIVFSALLLMYKFSNWTLERVQSELVNGDYLALPLILLVGIVTVILLLRVTYGILLLIMKPSPLPNTSDVQKFADNIKIKDYTIRIGKLIIEIILGSIESVLKFVEFIPNFFKSLNSLVLSEEDNKECNEKVSDDEKNLIKEIDNNDKGIKIVKCAAFCFAIVSFVATANGFINYVFTEPNQKYQAYLISFGIQAILFVFNLKLPNYLAYIGSLIPSQERRKNKRGRNKLTKMQKVIVMFYAIVICVSSIFSYVYIVNVVYAKTRYDDANIVLDSKYRDIVDDTEKFIYEEINFNRLLISEQLAELQKMIPKEETSFKTKNELQDDKLNAEKNLADKEVEYQEALDNFEASKMRYYETLEERWRTQEELQGEKIDFEKRRGELKTKEELKNQAEKELKEIEIEINNYKPSVSSVVKDFLIEMLQPIPSIDDYDKGGVRYLGLNSFISQLNEYIIQIDEDEVDMNNFSKVVSEISQLSISVNNYIKYTNIRGELIKETIIKIPVYGSDNYIAQITLWENHWRSYFKNIEEKIKSLPEYSDTNDLNERFANIINFDILGRYSPKSVIAEIDDLQRKNFSTINHFERAGNLLFSEYPFLAWFSLILAFFFDLTSLLAGIFIYYVNMKNNNLKPEENK